MDEGLQKILDEKEWYEISLQEKDENVLHLAIYPEKDENGNVRIAQVDIGYGTVFVKAVSTCLAYDNDLDLFLKDLKDKIVTGSMGERGDEERDKRYYREYQEELKEAIENNEGEEKINKLKEILELMERTSDFVP